MSGRNGGNGRTDGKNGRTDGRNGRNGRTYELDTRHILPSFNSSNYFDQSSQTATVPDHPSTSGFIQDQPDTSGYTQDHPSTSGYIQDQPSISPYTLDQPGTSEYIRDQPGISTYIRDQMGTSRDQQVTFRNEQDSFDDQQQGAVQYQHGSHRISYNLFQTNNTSNTDRFEHDFQFNSNQFDRCRYSEPLSSSQENSCDDDNLAEEDYTQANVRLAMSGRVRVPDPYQNYISSNCADVIEGREFGESSFRNCLNQGGGASRFACSPLSTISLAPRPADTDSALMTPKKESLTYQRQIPPSSFDRQSANTSYRCTEDSECRSSNDTSAALSSIPSDRHYRVFRHCTGGVVTGSTPPTVSNNDGPHAHPADLTPLIPPATLRTTNVRRGPGYLLHPNKQLFVTFTSEQIDCICEVVQRGGDVDRMSEFLQSLSSDELSRDSEHLQMAQAFLALNTRNYITLYQVGRISG